jgi:hypothetical protein
MPPLKNLHVSCLLLAGSILAVFRFHASSLERFSQVVLVCGSFDAELIAEWRHLKKDLTADKLLFPQLADGQ